MSDLQGPGDNRFDAVERLRRNPEGRKAADTGSCEAGNATSKLIRLPHRPRRMTDSAGDRPRKTWQPEGPSAFDPAPTRPVMRSELQRETGAWPVAFAPGWQPTSDDAADRAEHDGSVIDFNALRRKRAGGEAPASGIRRVAKPRRIDPGKS
ncbi:hypothetical protein [Nocardia tenerifensis]|uniref:hypothetical protein n=1 Tax=Nocardia tenerifensis TaxID=228006 RepID=UPI0011B5E0B8|nr:hypothetical protein [Nocardia tenerifensis]